MQNRKVLWRNLLQCSLAIAAIGLIAGGAIAGDKEKDAAAQHYADLVAADGPVAWYRFEEDKGANRILNDRHTLLADRGDGQTVDGVVLGISGAQPGNGFPRFDDQNRAALFDGQGSRIVIDDPGDKSPFDFDNGDTITLEAWVDLQRFSGSQILYIVGKGRTGRKGVTPDNQNWAMRLTNREGEALLTFVYHDRVTNQADPSSDWHRWTSETGVPVATGWHHLVLVYPFGDPTGLRGYIDGEPVTGLWDMGGPSTEPPVIDNDQVWIGSSMGGSPNSSFDGGIDEVAIYRKALTADQVAARFAFEGKRTPSQRLADASTGVLPSLPALPSDHVYVQVIEGLSDLTWKFDSSKIRVTDAYESDAFGFPFITRKYNSKGLIIDRSATQMLRAAATIHMPAGEHDLLLRSLNGARLLIDGHVVAETPFTRGSGDGYEKVPDMSDALGTGMRVLAAGHGEKVYTFVSDGQPHVIEVRAFLGGKKYRPEIGELSVSTRMGDDMFCLVSPRDEVHVQMTDADWEAYARDEQDRMVELNAQRRREVGKAEAAYWQHRHDLTRAAVAKEPPIDVPAVKSTSAVFNDVDRFIEAKLEEQNIEPAPLCDDNTFLRRIYIDTVGVFPTPAEIKRFYADPPETRRVKAIDRLLADRRWADNWVPYWQDVLAENPAILKATLNNTGPFRYFIRESFIDNKPIDRFTTELIMMEGSEYFGGPKGFEMATQNDVPMAAKAHVVGQAFLAIEMKCARCHDSPYSDVVQEDTFSVAAMLKRGGQKVPLTSSIPLDPEAIKRLIVEVTLKPGSTVQPKWPFGELIAADAPLPEGIVRDPKDSREDLAARITWYQDQRFARVIVNRLWARYLGFGIMSRVEDWTDLKPSHPKLLDYLARELVTNDYDLKHIARLIFNSNTYQRQIVAGKCEPNSDNVHYFASPMHRRMTAEQIVDSMFAAVGKRFKSEMLTMDPEDRRTASVMTNLGAPRYAWEFTSLSNERDRPSLSLPYAQSVVDVLSTFGWRQSRQNPLNCRDDTPTVQQPAILANGVVTRRIVGLSDDNALTQLALTASTPEAFIDGVYERLMTRPPTKTERDVLVPFIADGFEHRLVDAPPTGERPLPNRALAVSWSNHLTPEANEIKLEVEKIAREGDRPTARLSPDWRMRAEDAVWAVLNNPEFVFIP
ncbi:MAG: DUF1553 domain-containing protein [Planctomycetes bacterium]|nr:DUF1553 domain-containing protein [Planctomycetota bacterium]